MVVTLEIFSFVQSTFTIFDAAPMCRNIPKILINFLIIHYLGKYHVYGQITKDFLKNFYTSTA
jgi:hypothetical protein